MQIIYEIPRSIVYIVIYNGCKGRVINSYIEIDCDDVRLLA